MSKITYEQAWQDHVYLWETYAPAQDMTGAYVDQEDLDKLLKTPTKATARDCLCCQIDYWFQAGPDKFSYSGDFDDPILDEIAERHFMEDALAYLKEHQSNIHDY